LRLKIGRDQLLTIAKPPHNQKLALSGISLTKARLHKQSGVALGLVRDAIEKVVIESGYLEEAHFSWVTISILYGQKNDDIPKCEAVNEKYGDLPLSIEVDVHEILEASLDDLRLMFGKAVLKALIYAGKKFDRPVAPWRKCWIFCLNGRSLIKESSPGLCAH
jgi:hypothetical protein